MSTSASKTEEIFLKIFKFVILVVLSLALLITVGALGFAAYQYSQTPKAPAPAQKAPAKAVNVDDFLKSLGGEETKKEAPAKEEPKAEPPAKPDPIKYKEEAAKIVGCMQESNKLAEASSPTFNEESTENFRRQLQRVADASNFDRGQPFVTDAARVACEIFVHAKVVEYRKSHKEAGIFYDALNFHIKAWDANKEEARKFEQDEENRVKREQREEEERVALSKEAAKFTLLLAAGSFAFFMAVALYLIFAAIESNLRRIATGIEQATRRDTVSD